MSKFIPPTIEQIQRRIDEFKYSVDAEVFYYFYQSNGWQVGKSKMKCWMSALAGWEARDKKKAKKRDITKMGLGKWK